MSAPRRIAVVTGTRAEYGVLKSTMQAVSKRKNLKLQLIVTGIHLLPKFGRTIRDIRADGWTIDVVAPMQSGDDSAADQALGLGRGVQGIARFLERAQSDVVVVLGDRIEALAGALAGLTTGRFVAHLHGGDVAPGDIDDTMRHCITKLAHLHFPATADAARRIRRLGERPETIHVVGAPGLDHLREIKVTAEHRKQWANRVLVIQHASGRAPEREAQVMRSILRAVVDHGLEPAILYPNTDRGHSGIIEAINVFRKSGAGERAAIHRSLHRDDYLRALVACRLLVGNSSSGIIEAPTAGTAAVNIGDRQKGRLRAGRSVIDAGESYAAIHAAIGKALRLRPRRGARSPYGTGNAGSRIAAILARVSLSDALRRKQLTF